MRHPALVLGPKLARSVDAGHAEDDGAQSVDAGVIVNVLVGGAFRTAVGGVEVERLQFADAVSVGFRIGEVIAGPRLGRLAVGQGPVHLVGGGVEEHRRQTVAAPAYGLQDVVGAQHVDFQVVAGRHERSGDGSLGREVKDHIDARRAHHRLHQVGIAHVAADKTQPVSRRLRLEPLQIALHAGAHQAVEDGYAMTISQKVGCKVGADESRPAGDDDVQAVAS